MRSVKYLGAVAAMACLTWATSVAVVQAAPMSLTVQLSGSKEVPPVTTSGTGTAKLTYNSSSRVLNWSVTYSGLASNATMAHFHGPAPAGKSAGVQVWISKKGGSIKSPMKGHAKLTAAQAKQFMAGDWYVNVHTKKHPSGAIRGQVTPSK